MLYPLFNNRIYSINIITVILFRSGCTREAGSWMQIGPTARTLISVLVKVDDMEEVSVEERKDINKSTGYDHNIMGQISHHGIVYSMVHIHIALNQQQS